MKFALRVWLFAGMLVAAAIASLPATSASAADEKYDVVIKGGRVVDGTGTASYLADVAIKDGKIVHQIEFWPDPFQAPGWRARWVE